jgi:hypothetical protein
MGRRRKKRTDDGTPFDEQGRLTETHRVVFQGVPKDLQHIAFGVFNAPIDFATLKALGFADHGVQTEFNGFFKFGLLTGVDADVGKFENHVAVVFKVSEATTLMHLGVVGCQA